MREEFAVLVGGFLFAGVFANTHEKLKTRKVCCIVI